MKSLKRKSWRLSKRNASLKKRLLEAKKVIDSQNLEKLTENLTPFQKRFFACQLRNVRVKPKARTYTADEKMDALLLWKSSPTTYRNLNRLGFNLPTSVTLRKLLRQIPIYPGISQVIFDSLAAKAKGMAEKNKYCIVLFDEMAIQPHLDYEYYKDKIVGFEPGNQNIADHATVFMLRGVFKNWKQPVGFMFHKSAMPAENIMYHLQNIIRQCEKSGFTVISSVCDQGTNNVKAIKSLIQNTKRDSILKEEEQHDHLITISNTSFVPLFDPPHLLKSIRNNLLTKDLSFSVNNIKKIASWSHIEKAYDIDRSNNIRVMKKINDLHVLPHKIRKMKVSIAAQIFSGTVAAAIRYCALSGLKSTDGLSQLDASALETAELLLIFDNLFDSVNGSSARCDGKSLKQLVSSKSPHAPEWLRGIRLIKSMQFIKSKPSDRNRPPVLDGWETTLNGFLIIRKRLMDLGYLKFAARMFNQDPLENFFCQMRQYGVRNINPTCSAFSSYYKALLVKNVHHHPRDSNCEDDFSESISTIKEMINPSSSEMSCEPAERWHVPEIEKFDINQIEIAALGYVSGFLINTLLKTIPDCNICRRNLLHNGEPNEFHHMLISLKEYDVSMKKLKYSSVKLIKNLIKIYNLLQIFVPDALHKNYIKQRIVSVLKCEVDLELEVCEHSNSVTNFIFDSFTKLYIFNYIKKLNNIIMGKSNPNKKNAIENRCFELYKKRIHVKK